MFIARRGKDLFNHCKLCGNEDLYDKADNCVYKSDYKNSFMSSKAIANKYIKFDPTLPRISNIKCPNKKCMTNQKKDYFKDKILLSNMSYIISTKVLNILPSQIESVYEDLEDLPEPDSPDAGDDSADAGDDSPDASTGALAEHDKVFELDTLLHNQILITIKGKNIKPLGSLLKKNKFIKKNKVVVKKFTKPKSEVIFIKYDKENMRYLYYCCYCDTNWKNV
tara:strand:+ start:702 stop:1370 length:669 start_codon:yes stop_codon:yes gene_type:complete